jgi:hypothetical protein
MYFTNQIKTEGTEKLRNIILAFKWQNLKFILH